MEEFEKIKALITKGEIKEACIGLRKFAISGRTINEILLQEAKYYQLEREERNGVTANNHISTERNKIIHHLLQTVDDVKEESLGKLKEPESNKKNTESSSSLKKEEEKEQRRDELYKADKECYDYAIEKFRYDKRSAFGSLVNASIYYKYITLDYPDKSYGFLRLAKTLKVMYLLDYNNYRSEAKLSELASCIDQGKNLDKNKVYHDAYDLIFTDIEEYLRNKKIIGIILSVCIPIVIFVVIDISFLKFNFFDYKGENVVSMVFFITLSILLIYAFALNDKQEKYLM